MLSSCRRAWTCRPKLTEDPARDQRLLDALTSDVLVGVYRHGRKSRRYGANET
jgi:hypothetical protein